jgi:hypothetical protein
MTNIDPVVESAISWLEAQIETHRRPLGGDMSIRIYRMVEHIPMTIEQYWAVAGTWIAKRGKNANNEEFSGWLLIEAWQRLSDWELTDSALLHLVNAAPSAYHEVEALRHHLFNTASWFGPLVTWDADNFTKWIQRKETMFSVWSAAAIQGIPRDLHNALLAEYLKKTYWHECITIEAVAVLLEAKSGLSEVLQDGMKKYMDNRSKEPECLPQTWRVLDAWIDTFVWTAETARNNIRRIDDTLKTVPLWTRYTDKIGKGLTCVAAIPGAVQDALAALRHDPKVNVDGLHARLSSAVECALPEHAVLANLKADRSSLLILLANPSYSIDQRLGWLRTHTSCIIEAKQLTEILPHLVSPIREAAALACIIQATLPDANKDVWRAVGVSVTTTATQTKFLNLYAPELKPKIALIRTLGLSYQDALEMYLNDIGYNLSAEPVALTLPSLGA